MSNDDLIRRILRGQGPILGRITGTGTGIRKQTTGTGMRKQIEPTTAVTIGIDITGALGRIENAEASLRAKNIEQTRQYLMKATAQLVKISNYLTDTLQTLLSYTLPTATRPSEIQDMIDNAERSLFDALTYLFRYIQTNERDNLINVLANVNSAIGYLQAVDIFYFVRGEQPTWGATNLIGL